MDQDKAYQRIITVMKSLLKYLCFFGLAVCFGSAVLILQVHAEQNENILPTIREKNGGITTMAADYTRVTRTPAMEGVFQSTAIQGASGRIYFKKPDKLSLRQEEPQHEEMVTDGRTVWWYIPIENQVRVYPDVDVYGEIKPLLDFLGGMDSLEGRFQVKVTPAGTDNGPDHRLDLTRLEQGAGPSEITVFFSTRDFSLSGFRLTSLTGEITDFTLTNLERNPEIRDDFFRFEIPPGTEVIEEKHS
jgi:outer membrane lipoprotein carrier protein